VSAAVLIEAHAGHWFAGLLYLAPVLIVVGALLWQSHKDKQLGDDEDDPDDHGEAGHYDVS
jgi:hypothetical protein